jgi:hypothetical protein
MSARHQTSEYKANARIIRARVRAAHSRGESVTCWRCRGAITPGMAYDVGHIHGAIGNTLLDLAPEHRHRTGPCPGNRSDGGRRGAAITNRRHVTIPSNRETSWPI